MEKEYIYLKQFTRNDLEKLSEKYAYIVTCKDKFLSNWVSNWYMSEKASHYHLILCKDEKEKDIIYKDVDTDNSFAYVNYYPLKKCFFNNILNYQKRYDITLRNDWTRVFK